MFQEFLVVVELPASALTAQDQFGFSFVVKKNLRGIARQSCIKRITYVKIKLAPLLLQIENPTGIMRQCCAVRMCKRTALTSETSPLHPVATNRTRLASGKIRKPKDEALLFGHAQKHVACACRAYAQTSADVTKLAFMSAMIKNHKSNKY